MKDVHQGWLDGGGAQTAAAAVAGGISGLLALILTVRASMGAFDREVSALIPVATTTIAAIGSLTAWFLRPRGMRSELPPRIRTALRLGVGLGCLAPPALVGWATTVNASPAAPGLVAGILVLGLAIVVSGEVVQMDAAAVRAAGDRDSSAETMSGLMPRCSPGVEHSPGARPPDTNVLQQMARRRAPDGTELIEGMLTARFDPGERETALHLPIHPVLPASPHVECEPLDASPVVAAVAAAYPYGVRIDVKRDGRIDQELVVPIGVEVSTEQSATQVA